MRGITSKDSKIFHVNLLGCNNFTFDGINIKAPRNSLNTEGIHIEKSTNIKILDTKIGTGDDCISLGDGTKNVTVESLYCGPGGHGISVGSLGKFPNEEPVEGLFVKSCTLTNTDFGLRIKTWPDTPSTITVTDLHFQDILMINVKNPAFIDQEYCPWNQCTNKQNPSKIKISKVTFKNIRGTSATQEGVVLNCSSVVPCEGVELTDVSLKFNGAAAMAKCVNVKPLLRGKAPICTP
ncbi:hypothetical protein PIB30_025345 [Stylosanthes scabra]|uniref:Uncharacterized protein n=1 Tax=Stylosanthes scabra TaxID=79078 RepID=A0ABU6XAY2_9FABA|nr:hypothetical protein [Stylosanthes scabra]